MKSSLKNATAAESKRMDIIKRDIGCIACYIEYHVLETPASAHHLLSGGRRISHLHTIPLCYDHHQGERGIHTRKRWVRDTYGTDNELLALTNELLAHNTANTITAI